MKFEYCLGAEVYSIGDNAFTVGPIKASGTVPKGANFEDFFIDVKMKLETLFQAEYEAKLAAFKIRLKAV